MVRSQLLAVGPPSLRPRSRAPRSGGFAAVILKGVRGAFGALFLFLGPARGTESIETPLSQKAEQLKTLLTPVVEGEGMQLWGLEYHSGSTPPVLRIYIDGENGVTVDDCARVSDQAGAVIEVEEALKGNYTLEVSSPGIERPLFTPEQFRTYIGHPVKVRLAWPEHDRRNFRGVLLSVEDPMIEVEVDGMAYELPLAAIHNARVLEQL